MRVQRFFYGFRYIVWTQLGAGWCSLIRGIDSNILRYNLCEEPAVVSLFDVFRFLHIFFYFSGSLLKIFKLSLFYLNISLYLFY